MQLDRNGLQVLDRDECLRMLATATVGRIGISVGALPVVLPVNFRLIGDEVIIRTGIGTKLDAATQNAVVAFEVDEFDSMYHSGWSVVVTGMARELEDPPADLLGFTPRWAPGNDGRLVAISTDHISGRRMAPGLS